MLAQVYEANAMKKAAVYKWGTRFSEGRGVTDEERSGRPATSRPEETIAKVHQIVRENCRLTVKSIAKQANIDIEAVRRISTEDLDKRKVVQKWSQRTTLFDDTDDIRSNTTAALKVIPQNQFKNCFEGWTRRLHRCIVSRGTQ
ncbi:hypothetical protein B7P43_G02635 [Cryptotermes secundus]|uniref:Mos1 transposase HTH domain-containing protein n=1 Tax=Cryptotermes secundus TaxID=105785 RepID=A0A2J7RG90_9NEOP|nr:hypothetical protein B7P43_G02635 [Cryptotermes secundus]